MNAPYNPYSAPAGPAQMASVQVLGAPQGTWLKWPCAAAVPMFRCDAARRALAGMGGPVPMQPTPSWGSPPGYG